MREAITRRDACFVDQGYGAHPGTTLETRDRWRAVNPALFVVGVEIDAERVARGRPFASEDTRFLRGGFDVELPRPATVLRAMNVLRQYDESEVANAWRCMGRNLAERGILVEGTCDPWGRVLVVNILQRRGDTLAPLALVFSTNFREGFQPSMFQPRLPKNLIHRVTPGEPVHQLFTDWNAAFEHSLAWRPYGPRAVFFETARRLAAQHSLRTQRQLLHRGVMWLTPGDLIEPVSLGS